MWKLRIILTLRGCSFRVKYRFICISSLHKRVICAKHVSERALGSRSSASLTSDNNRPTLCLTPFSPENKIQWISFFFAERWTETKVFQSPGDRVIDSGWRLRHYALLTLHRAQHCCCKKMKAKGGHAVLPYLCSWFQRELRILSASTNLPHDTRYEFY